MRIHPYFFLFAAALATPVQGVEAQELSDQIVYDYADLADLALAAPLVLSATIDDATKLKPERAIGVLPGHVRFYVEADVLSLFRGAGGIPSRIAYLVDVPLDSRGKAPKLEKLRVLLLARQVPGNASEIQLVAPDAQLAWSPATETQLRSILTEATRADAPPLITGVGNAFHVPGSLPGEGETQIFLQTQDGRPVSLSILRRPGQQPRWAVSLSEIVDEAAAPPKPDTLLWYRLACSLPAELPDHAVEDIGFEQARIARADYKLVIEGLGPCTRTREAPSPSGLN